MLTFSDAEGERPDHPSLAIPEAKARKRGEDVESVEETDDRMAVPLTSSTTLTFRPPVLQSIFAEQMVIMLGKTVGFVADVLQQPQGIAECRLNCRGSASLVRKSSSRLASEP
jgi:hypothetical protein